MEQIEVVTTSLKDLHLMRNAAFDTNELEKITGISGWDRDFTYCSIDMGDYLYYTTLGFIQSNFEDVEADNIPGFNHSFEATYSKAIKHPFDKLANPNTKEKVQENEESEKNRKKGVFTYNSFKPGLGLFRFKWEDNDVFALHQAVGKPQGNRLMTSRGLILFVKDRNKRVFLQRLLDHIVEEKQAEMKPLPDTFKIYRYQTNIRAWRYSHKSYGRSIESVVLPRETKDVLLEDLDDFLSEENKSWYLKHGIPYKRCYLFYGVPGSGKTSLISVIAALHGRSVCYLSPSDPNMSDDTLRHAIQNLPEKAIVVLEDIDALFTRDRQTKTRNSLTFSGLLNALDGVGSGMGQIFILSTNYREKLDKALIRNGRVDKHIKFDYIKECEAREMFGIFYEKATREEKEAFGQNLFKALERRKISAATLQHFFIIFRKRSKEEAIENIAKEIIEIINSNHADEDERVSTEMYIS